ncbi:alcohol dehydrogenase catalytic domain-containing protein [Amycolatopsis sp. K13G38]|uniref:Alcohol dehydrogenase catalytic domain-containing protein n=2 Tax=Amycolatopsis acididurans TaxID=2724524 RepID=A0ABX1IWJ6_9PSEU|nr:alcohol dehydrogenase catalytic domain-containing protein [Amycolatopsis acididurans]
MTRTIEAAVLRAPKGGTEPDFSRIAVEEVELDGPGDGEILVDIRFASLCHSDLSVLTGDRPRPLPMVLGHEASGIVREVGRAVDTVRPGDPVVFTYVAACGRCGYCRDGRPVLCSRAHAGNSAGELSSGGHRLRDRHGETVHHHLGISAFAQQAVVDAASVVPLPSEMDLRTAALFGCAVSTGVGAVLNAAKVGLGRSAAVFGCGGVGLAAILGLRAVGAAPIIAVDLRPENLGRAKELGADIVLPAGEDAAEEIRRLTGGGVHHAFDAAGAVPAIASGYASLRRGGKLTMVGLPNPAARWEVPPAALVANDITLCGSYLGSSVPVRDIPRFVELHRAGRLPVDRLAPAAAIGLGEIGDGMARLHHGFPGRIVVDPALR